MSNFVVKYCSLTACQHWRLANKCAKNGMSMADSVKYLANMHDSSVCEVRKQLDKYRLEQLLEK